MKKLISLVLVLFLAIISVPTIAQEEAIQEAKAVKVGRDLKKATMYAFAAFGSFVFIVEVTSSHLALLKKGEEAALKSSTIDIDTAVRLRGLIERGYIRNTIFGALCGFFAIQSVSHVISAIYKVLQKKNKQQKEIVAPE